MASDTHSCCRRGIVKRCGSRPSRTMEGSSASTVKDLVVGSGLSFLERGSRVLKGVGGEWRLFAAT